MVNPAILQKYAQKSAENIFTKLDTSLLPEVIVICIRKFSSDYSIVNMFPENEVYDPSLFKNVYKKTNSLREFEGNTGCKYCFLSQNDQIDGCVLQSRPIRMVIQQIVMQNQNDDIIPFFSDISMVDDDIFLVILQFNKDAYQKHYSLSKSEKSQGCVINSLIHATAFEFLNEWKKTFHLNLNDIKNIINRDYDEIIRSAGKIFVNQLAWTCWKKNLSFDLFNAVTTISSLKYEGSENGGKIILSKKEHINITETVKFSYTIKLTEYRGVRKLLEMTRETSYLLCDANEIYGMGIISGSYDQRNEDLLTIKFITHHDWELLHAENVLMRVTYGEPKLLKPIIAKSDFFSATQDIFNNISNKKLEILWTIIDEASKQRHGTTIVVYEDAQLEAERLQYQSTLIDPIPLTVDMVTSITSIDGAVLLDIDSICYAIGVILDGIATNKGTSSRGARYNSAVRYVEMVEKPCLVTVISEDGSIDLIHK
ncbi:MAG TPA: hypothetical protein DF698_05770 [Candidatus Atribacteria bacterium]|nr:hypothetical protein [Candidatus Atribacteria bacterium]